MATKTSAALSASFLDAIERGVILCDGAMGTALHSRGVPISGCLEQVNLTDPDLVAAVHREYAAAGADVIETNTFGANGARLARHELAGSVRKLNLAAVEIARRVQAEAGRTLFVAGAVGPIGVGMPSSEAGDVSLRQARRLFREQAEALAEGGVDLILLETISTLAEAKEALAAVRDACDLPVVAQLTFQRDGRTWAGEDPAEVVRALQNLGADVIGVNCVAGPQAALEILQKMSLASGARLAAQPNAGQPRMLEQGQLAYPVTPETFGEYAPKLVAAGAALIGGCCGTTPAHITAMRRALGGESRPRASRKATAAAAPAHPAAEPEPETLREKLAAGRFIVTVEVDPPRGLNPRRALEGVALLKEAGVDVINVGDSPRAQVRMSPLVMAHLVQSRVGLETIVHFTTRDRNLMALQSDLIGAHVLGLHNVLCLKGDAPTGGGFARSVAVWDVSTVGLIRVLKGLNEGLDWAGNSVGQPTSFFIGAAANPEAPDLEKEMKLLRRKLDAGADFIMTQAVFDAAAVDRFLTRVAKLQAPVLLGIIPLHNSRHAEFLHKELAGIVVPEAIRERMRKAGEKGQAEGLAIAREMIDAVAGHVAGVYLMPAFGRYETGVELAALARKTAGA